MLIVVTYRPEYEPAWSVAPPHVSVLRVEPLPRPDAHTLVTDLVGGAASATPLAPLLLERTDGNPFFIEESVRHLVESGVLVGAAGGRSAPCVTS